MAETYDFIIVGGGPAGSTIARRLADSSPASKILLLEGGSDNSDPDLRIPSNRFILPFTQPRVTYGYKSTPQPQLNNREINCARGRGLGGSSAINYCTWQRGHKEDFNHWAEIVGGEVWKWDGKGRVKERFDKIENLHNDLDEVGAKYFDPEALNLYSRGGRVDLTFGTEWPELATPTMEGARGYGMKLNEDGNSGDPTGWWLSPSTFYNGARVTGATAYLSSPPSNLVIKVDSWVSQVIFDESKTAVGVKTLSGTTYRASKEVILSAGSIDTPKILLLSGVGPAAELSALSITVVADVPAVGKNMKDHCYVTTTLLLKPGALGNTTTTANPLGDVGIQCICSWFSLPTVKSSAEFTSLDKKTQELLTRLPSCEFLSVPVPLAVDVPAVAFEPGRKVMTIAAAVMNAQSSGSVTLASTDPTAAPLIDVSYLSHPYDKRVAIEGLRTAIAFTNTPYLAAITEKRIEGPSADADDETLWEHCKKSVNPVWHFASTCRMGNDGDQNAVVDAKYRVKGVKALRVVDLSVAAWLPNNHTQSTAYLIGETAAEKIIEEYGW